MLASVSETNTLFIIHFSMGIVTEYKRGGHGTGLTNAKENDYTMFIIQKGGTTRMKKLAGAKVSVIRRELHKAEIRVNKRNQHPLVLLH